MVIKPLPRPFLILVSVVFTASIFLHPSTAVAQVAPVAQPGSGFGGVVAFGGDELVVGSAPIGWPSGHEAPGAVLVYRMNRDGLWVEDAAVHASDGVVGDHFGRGLAVSPDYLVVGAPGLSAAYVYEKENGSWIEAAKLAPSTIAEGSEFGGGYARGGLRQQSIAIAGDRIAVTTVGEDGAHNAVHVFRPDGSTFVEEAVLTAPDDSIGFAWSVAAAGDELVVGTNSANGPGSVYVYRRDPWTLRQTISPEELGERSGFGRYIAVHGNMMYVGATGHEGGTVFAFVRDVDGSWSEAQRIAGPPPPEGARRFGGSGFGGSIAATDDHLLVTSRGGVFAFSARDAMSTPSRIEAPDERSTPSFGSSIAANGDYAVIGSPDADYDAGLANAYAYDDVAGWKHSGLLASQGVNLPSVVGNQVDCTDGMAGAFECDQVDLLSFVSRDQLTDERGVKLTDLWGWEDPLTGKEWVLQGRNDGTAFVDISDPYNPVYVGQMYRTEGSPGSVWRDVKVYSNHAYVVADGAREHGVQVFDLTRLRGVDPADMPVTFEADTTYHGTASTHNIVINEESGFAYAVGNGSGGETCGGQLHIIDIREPKNPKFAGCFTHERGGTHDSQCVIYRGPDVDYAGREVCFSSNGSSFVIADVTRKDSTFTIAAATYPNVAYTHQGWLTEEQDYFYMNDELDEMYNLTGQTRTLVWDISELDDPQLVKEFYHGSGASDHNLYIRGDYVYESNYQAGLRILDISDRENPVEAGHFDTAPYAEDAAGFGGSWSNYPYFDSGVIVVSSQNEGLFVLRHRRVDS